jgi:hypothetical protein
MTTANAHTTRQIPPNSTNENTPKCETQIQQIAKTHLFAKNNHTTKRLGPTESP